MKRNSWCYPPSKPVWADLESGEGVWRLQRAFQMAGAHAVLVRFGTSMMRLTCTSWMIFHRNWLGTGRYLLKGL
jgi:hypothetical protein